MSETIERSPASFRDPSGFVFTRGGVLFRQVSQSYRDDYDALFDSGLYDELIEAQLMVGHEVSETEPSDDDAYIIIAPEPVSFISYPYEWCFGQLKDAALVTLDIQARSLRRGMILKDASAYNIQFYRGKPTLIDTLSFERLEVTRPWVAYRQFCRHFLGPLALMSKRDPSLGLLARAHIDGVPLSLTSRLLPFRSKLSFPLLTHIHLHASAERRYAGADSTGSSRKMTMSAHLGLIDSLYRVVNKMTEPSELSNWESYDQFHLYGEESLTAKKDIVGRFIEQVEPEMVWDLGANVGDFSRIASAGGAITIAFDFDHGAVERNYSRVRQNQDRKILPLVLDLTNPSPALGWAHVERDSLLDRAPADMVLALALVHHLAIGNNVPLREIASFFSKCGRWTAVEFVPKHDPQAQKLLANRNDIFADYTRDGFEAAFQSEFEIRKVEPILGTDRVLYLMERRGH